MNDASLLPVDLLRAASSLQDRFELLRVPIRRISRTEWDHLPARISHLIPPWIPELLAAHCLAGGVLEYRDREHPYVRQFAFFEPTDFVKGFQEGSLFWRLIGFQLFPFANEANGNVWVTGLESGPDSAIQLLELSDWNGDKPCTANGLLFACGNLAMLMATMGISEASYYSLSIGQRSTLWCKAT